MKNLVQRTVSGILYLIIIIGSLFLGKYAFATVFGIMGVLALIEFYDLTGIHGLSKDTIIGILSGILIFVLAFLVASGNLGIHYLAIASLVPVVMFVITLYNPQPDLIKDMSNLLLGILYIIIPLAITHYLVFPAVNGFQYTHRVVLGVLILVWINDTGAYVTGSSFGRHKLFPSISPKKSWEGLVGGTLFTLAAAVWMAKLVGILTTTDWIILAMVVSVFGVYGDLTESLIKRNANRKDSGTLIPGHGGVLDRIDSILFVMPVTFLYMVLRGL